MDVNLMTERYRVFKIDNSYGVSDDIANYTVAWDTSKIIMDRLCAKLNEQEQRIQELEEENHDLKFDFKTLKLSKHVGDGEWNIRDITCMAGKFRLEEWGERYHQFYDGDTELEDEAVVIMLLENKKLIEELKERIKELEYQLDVIDGLYASDQEDMSHPFRLDYKKVLNR